MTCSDCPKRKFHANNALDLYKFRNHHLEKDVLHRMRVEERMKREAPVAGMSSETMIISGSKKKRKA